VEQAVGTALVRRPGPRLAEGIVTHGQRRPIDLAAALHQWERYCAVLETSGWDLIEAPPADDCPDAVFIEDTVVVFRNVAVVTRPGADARKPEVDEVARCVESLGLSTNRIHEPGTLDGGDVLKVGDTVYVGRGGRTNGEGIGQLRSILAPLGAEVVAVPTTRVLHLKSAVTALPDGTVIGYEANVDDPRIFDRFLPVPEESGAAVLALGGQRLLMGADCPRSAALLADLGYEPVPTNIAELQKLEGCVTCLSVRVRALPAQRP
jgi:dimethylargininase